MLTLRSFQVKEPFKRANLLESFDFGGKLRIATFDVLIPADVKEFELILAKLPVGKLRVLGDLSFIETKVNTLKSVDIGWLPYRSHLKGRIPGSKDGLNKRTTKPIFKLCLRCPARTKIFDTLEGLYISAIFKGDFVKGNTVAGYIVYIKD